jgi:hypothetical protein
MSLLVQHGKKIDILEVECNMLHNLALNLRQQREPMEIEKRSSPQTDEKHEEAGSAQIYQ